MFSLAEQVAEIVAAALHNPVSPEFAALDSLEWPWPLWRVTARPYDWSWDD